MTRIRTLIVDDEPLARRGLVLRLQKIDDVDLVGECGNGRDALAQVASLKPDLVFLDIQMPVMDGFEVLRQMQGPEMPMVVFVTAYDQYAVRAFEAHALDYVLKPIDDDRLDEALGRVRELRAGKEAINHRERLLELMAEMSGSGPIELESLMESGLDALDSGLLKTLPIKDGSRTTCVPMESIDWIDAAGDYMCVHVGGDTHIMRGTMKRLESILDPKQFQRVHRSTIVNVGRVREVRSHINGEYFLMLEGGIELKMSRNYKDKISHFVPQI